MDKSFLFEVNESICTFDQSGCVNDFGVGRLLPDVNAVGHAVVINSGDSKSDDVTATRSTSETVE
jgi:hypothetical protein